MQKIQHYEKNICGIFSIQNYVLVQVFVYIR